MALNITTVATRLGVEIAGVNESNTFSSSTAVSRANSINSQFAAFASQREVTDDLYENLASIQSGLASWTEYLASLLGLTLSTMCRDDTQRPSADDVRAWFDKLNRDMVSGGDSFNQPSALTATVAAAPVGGGSNVGDGQLLTSVVEPVDGKSCYFAMKEVIRAVCTASSYTGQTPAGGEIFAVDGETSVENLSPFWPKGSGATATMTVVDPDTAAIIEDGRLELWTLVSGSDYRPTDWTLYGSTTAGTHINRGTSSPYAGTYYARMIGNGSTLSGFYQVLDQDIIRSNTNYGLVIWYKKLTGTISSGVLRLALTDGSGTVLSDNGSTSLSSTVAAGTLNGAASWTAATAVFALPRNLPTEAHLEIRFSTALDNSAELGIDHITFVELERFYQGGPYMKLVSGATAFATNDGFTNTIVNTNGTSNDPTRSFVRSLDRVFDLKGNDLRLTVSGTPTQLDTLIA